MGAKSKSKTLLTEQIHPKPISSPGLATVSVPHAWKGGGLGNRAPKLTSPPAWQGAVHVKCRTSHLGVASQLQALESQR
jgi:hypothetical protein